MSLFQKSVEKKYLNELDSALIDAKYSAYSAYFGNKLIQQNIKSAKEEQFQEGFLRELFVKILGYTLQPEPDYNLISEYKNITNSRKADGAILRAGEALAVIELKSLSTTDLDTIESQAFGYKNHHPKCIYVITSNFGKLRFYIQNAVDYIDFDLFNLSRNQFCLLWLCLAKDNLLNDVPLKIKESSLLQEENITKKLYADYSKFRNAIYNNLVKNNPELDKLLLFKKTQKLLDRFLFVFFAEDRLLLPPNSIREIINQWETLRDVLDEYVPLYDRFKKYFGYLNTGFKNKNIEIFAYNGGLFADDEILDNITIDDEILYHHTLKLSQYDFDTEVDVNILGHIFEHSLGEIENVQAEIQKEVIGRELKLSVADDSNKELQLLAHSNLAKSKSKRKKDGIYYTPKYITKYIVENTVGKLCAEKRVQFGINPEDYAIERTKKDKDIIIALDEKLSNYRNWLLTITILDPACGSGAFLNQALEFLIEEHRKLDELRALLFGGGLVFADITTDILENNIFGVDINEESVEIAKLSLWLRTAQKGRKLNTLTSNIKCGNSLIDDPQIAGEKAFDWAVEFPVQMSAGGFDVVIGNPPYGAELSKNEIEYLDKTFDLHSGTKNSAIYFIKKADLVAKNEAFISFIIPKSICYSNGWSEIAKFVINNLNILIDTGEAFESVLLEQVIFINKKGSNNSIFQSGFCQDNSINYSSLLDKKVFYDYGVLPTGLTSSELELIKNIIKKNSRSYGDFVNIKRGLNWQSRSNTIGSNSPIYRGAHLDRYYLNNNSDLVDVTLFKNDDYQYMMKPKVLNQLAIAHVKNPYPHFYLQSYLDLTNSFVYETISCTFAKYDYIELKFILALNNSKLFAWLVYKLIYSNAIRSTRFDEKYISKLPFPNIENNPEAQLPFIELADIMLEKNKELQDVKNKFLDLLKADFSIEKLSTKLQNWYELSWADFTAELRKLKIELKGIHKEDWSERLSRMTTQAQEIKTLITQTDRTIDRLVYQLYELTEDEVKVVEGE